jgi:hypothetical protein
MRNGYTFWWEILKERNHLEDLGRWENKFTTDLNEIGEGSVPVFIWLKIGTSCGL